MAEPITHREHDGRVTLEMSCADFDEIRSVIRRAQAADVNVGDRTMLWRWQVLENRLNEQNGKYTPWEIPPEYQRA